IHFLWIRSLEDDGVSRDDRRRGVRRWRLTRSRLSLVRHWSLLRAGLRSKETYRRRRTPSVQTMPVPSNKSEAGSGVGAGPSDPTGVRSKVKAKPPLWVKLGSPLSET